MERRQRMKKREPRDGRANDDEQKRYSNRMGEQMTMNKRGTVTGWESK